MTITEEFYPGLVQQIRELEAQANLTNSGSNNSDNGDDSDAVISLERPLRQREEAPDYIDSSPPAPDYIDSSDVESHAGSIDSIQRNADFVLF